MKFLVVGAGVIGCYTAARMLEVGHDIKLLARGEKAKRLADKGITIKNGITGEVSTYKVPIIESPVKEYFDIVIVCVRSTQRESVLSTLVSLKGIEVYCFIGNTLKEYDEEAEVLGEDRILTGFTSIGGRWENDELIIVDRKSANIKPFDSFIIGTPFEDSHKHIAVLRSVWKNRGLKMTTYNNILDWHLTHVVIVSQLAAALYRHGGDFKAISDDDILIAVNTMREIFAQMRKHHFQILPRPLNGISFLPRRLVINRIRKRLEGPFTEIGLTSHIHVGREEVFSLVIELRDLITNEGESLPLLNQLVEDIRP
ncbi:ketopantoate reductase family protein [Spirochaeta cellobiosiphila]|uniref:ketopantoate reductase family protein n=1 Tax=Spirochaeta cellobiosiphila TaxID=504483 RepID=UPI00041EC934|nr:2-dehydropantoate 2-reductase N-terminal domain-containing protein [Spirochaeta cellobiosiphila]